MKLRLSNVRRESVLNVDTLFPVLYAVFYALTALVIHLAFFPIGDIGVETDFYGELAVAAQELWDGHFSVANYPYKGPVYSLAIVLVHVFGGDWYRNAIVLNVVCAALSLVVLYRLLLKVFNRLVAVFSVVFVSLVLEFFLQSHKASSDMLFFLLCYLSIYLLLTDEFSWPRLIGSGVVSALTFLTRYNGIVLPVSALIVLILVNPGRWPLRRRVTGAAAYTAAFLAVCAPWLAVSYMETGSILASRNIENLVQEFYSGKRAADVPEGGFGSFGALFLNDPVYFVRHYLSNIPRHLWKDFRISLTIDAGILAVLGLLRLLFVPPTRRQWTYFIFPASIFLTLCAVFHLPRFSMPVTPAYYAVGFSLLFGSGSRKRSGLGKVFERRFSRYSAWMDKDLAGVGGGGDLGRGSGEEPAGGKEISRVAGKKIVTSVPRLTWRLIIVVFASGILLSTHIAMIVRHEGRYYERRPLFILNAARFLRVHARQTGQTGRPLIMARKPHIAYYAGFEFKTYPKFALRTVPSFIAYAIDRNVDYIVYSDIEKEHFSASEFLGKLDDINGVTRIYDKPEIVVYRLEEWLDMNTEAGKKVLEQYLSHLEEIKRTKEPELIIRACYDLAGYYSINGEWGDAEKYFLESLKAVEQLPDSESSREYYVLIRLSLSQAYLELGKYEEGVDLLEEEIRGCEARGDRALLANAHYLISNHYRGLGQKENALKHLMTALDLYISLNDHSKAAAIVQTIERMQGE